jgi:hypothetical protein
MKAVTWLRLFALVPLCQLLGCTEKSTEHPLAPGSLNVGGISTMRFDDSEWSTPVPLESTINTAFNEQGPTLSPDGLSLYFCSNKPVTGAQGGNDLWVSHRASEEDPWEAAVNLGPTVNSSGGDCGPNISPDGHLLFFTSNGRGGLGGNDLFVSRREDTHDDLAWEAPVPLGSGVNTPIFEFSPFFLQSAEEGPTNFYFERGSSNVVTDILAAAIKRDGEASDPAEPVVELNSPAADGHPTIRADGREVFIHSNRSGVNFDIYVATRRSIHDPWSTPSRVDAVSISGAHEIHPSLSHDGRTLVFTRGLGTANDIWMSVRTPRGR